ncbi:MAG: hypothetical protein CMM03_03630 [Rhodopirellula sp.]|nr:hypothetical protein [Rhodopirellula sp.]
MANNKSPIIFIPARAGSKSIRHKNLSDVGGVPLLLNSIITSIDAGYSPVVSSDSDYYLSIANQFKECIIHKRPKIQATDVSVVWDAVIDFLQPKTFNESDICILYEPTSPFVIDKDLRDMVTLMEKNSRSNYITNLSEIPATQSYINQRLLTEYSRASFIFKERYNIDFKQQTRKTFCFGNLHGIRLSFLKKQIIPYEMPYNIIPFIRSLSIDSQEDLDLASAIALGNHPSISKKFSMLTDYLYKNSIDMPRDSIY